MTIAMATAGLVAGPVIVARGAAHLPNLWGSRNRAGIPTHFYACWNKTPSRTVLHELDTYMPSSNHKDQAFSSSVLPYASHVLALARTLTASEPDAEEIAQEAMLRAWKYFDGFEGEAALPWLEAIVRNTYRTWRSRQRRILARRHRPCPARFERRIVHTLLVREAIARLPDGLRAVLLLHEVAGWNCAEIAARFALPLSEIYGRLCRARMVMRKMLREFR